MRRRRYPISPTPWSVKPEEFGITGGVIRDAEGYEVAQGMSLDNAYVMAAAPELLDACKQLTVAIVAIKSRLAAPQDEREQKAVDELFRLYTLGQAAIAKVEGRS